QKMAEQLPVHDCLDKIFSQGDIIKRYIAANKEENQQKVAANCQRFLELSLETNSGRYPSITRFLQNLHHLRNYSANPPEEPLSQSGQSRVRLMTIHGSKGLEAPVIFLADCNGTKTNKNAYHSLIHWPADKSQPTNFQLQLSKDNTDQITEKLQQKKLDEQAREELNLLYVALTRARERLFISGIASSRSQQNSWYQIIASGLKDNNEYETGINKINARLYKHLSYDDAAPVLADPHQSNQRSPLEIDPRLLKPVEIIADDAAIAPASLTEEDTSSNHFDAKTEQADKNNIIDSAATQNIAIWRGITIHRILELLCNSKSYPATEQIMNTIQQQLTTEIRLQKPAYIEYLDSCLKEALANFNHPDCELIFNPEISAQTYNEMPLMHKAEQQPPYGIVDRVIKSEDTVLIIDYKSH
ncbi:MAG: hypothetical protein KAT90_09830, partial [Gammaproteobacteria bacterium]|nr:hypothetical protein [Gammaproteobacteria bacterium]